MLVLWIAKRHSGWPLSMPKRCCLWVSPASKLGSVSVERMELIMAWHLGKSYIWHLSSRKPSTCPLAPKTAQIWSLFWEAEKFHFPHWTGGAGWGHYDAWWAACWTVTPKGAGNIDFSARHIEDREAAVLLCVLLLEVLQQESSATSTADTSQLVSVERIWHVSMSSSSEHHQFSSDTEDKLEPGMVYRK